MELKISACGLICSKCDAYIATQLKDRNLLEVVAADWRKRFHNPYIRAECIQCNGCMTEGGPKCVQCENSCQIRKCVLANCLSSCGECANYPCPALLEYLSEQGEQGAAQKKLLDGVNAVEQNMRTVLM